MRWVTPGRVGMSTTRSVCAQAGATAMQSNDEDRAHQSPHHDTSRQ